MLNARIQFAAVAAYVLACTIQSANAADLKLSWGSKNITFTSEQLLKRAETKTVKLKQDPAYKKAMTYRAIPLLNVLAGLELSKFDILQVAATDGYVSQLPVDLITRGASGGAVAWLAIEDPAKPWSKLPGKDINPGPFYLIWQNPERSGVTPAQWPYAIGSLSGQQSPQMRWPQMAVADGNDKAKRGMAVYVKHCISCHKIDGAGEAEIGPDMARPMSPTVYMSPKGLRALIRNPQSVRTWPKQEMDGFAKDVLPDAQLEELVTYMTYIATKPGK